MKWSCEMSAEQLDQLRACVPRRLAFLEMCGKDDPNPAWKMARERLDDLERNVLDQWLRNLEYDGTTAHSRVDWTQTSARQGWSLIEKWELFHGTIRELPLAWMSDSAVMDKAVAGDRSEFDQARALVNHLDQNMHVEGDPR